MVVAGGGAGFIAVQGALDDPAHRRVYVDRDAMNRPAEQVSLKEGGRPAHHAPGREWVEVESMRADDAAARQRQGLVL